MLYALICTDKPGSSAGPEGQPPATTWNISKSLGDSVVLAGPFTEEDGQTMNGSLIVVEAALA